MAKPLRPKRGTTAKNDAFVGMVGEITVDTEKHNIRVHDGVTAGGHALATDEDLAAVRAEAQAAQAAAETSQSSANVAQASAGAAQAAADAAQATANACLPLSGGTMAGKVTFSSDRVIDGTNTSGLFIVADANVSPTKTGCISVFPVGHSQADRAGGFQFVASDGTNNTTLTGSYANGLKWGGDDVVIAKARSLSNNGYVKFSNGLIVQWGYTGSGASGTVTFPTAFSSASSYRLSVQAYAGNVNENNPEIQISDRSTTAFTWTRKNGRTNDWIAIGY